MILKVEGDCSWVAAGRYPLGHPHQCLMPALRRETNIAAVSFRKLWANRNLKLTSTVYLRNAEAFPNGAF